MIEIFDLFYLIQNQIGYSIHHSNFYLLRGDNTKKGLLENLIP